MTATDSARTFGLAVLLATQLFTPRVFAQASASNARAAQLLFDEAKRLADQKDYRHACPKFVQSHQLDPAGGTILHAADCHEHEGKLASAWAEYNEALSYAVKSNRTDREAIARSRIDALAPKLAKLHVELPSSARTLPDFGIWLDGARTGSAGPLLDAPIPVDAGVHVVEARATGHLTERQELTIADGQEHTVTFSDLAVDPNAQTTVAPAPGPSKPASGLGPQRTAGLAVAAAGGVGLVLGTVFGIRALGIGDQSDQCTLGPQGTGCPQSAVDDQERARTSGTLSTVAFVSGGILAAGGLALFFTAPSRSTRAALFPLRVTVGGREPTLSVSGAF